MHQLLKKLSVALFASMLAVQPVMAADLSAVQPISKGGTGATTVSGARANLGITGGTPGGSSGQVQYNNSGTFDGLTLANTLNLSAGILGTSDSINAQTGTSYTILSTDMGKTITQSNSSASAYTLPAATTTGFGITKSFSIINIGSGIATITPTTSTINGLTTLALAQYSSAYIISDGFNYFAFLGGSGATASNVITSTSANAFTVGANGTTNPVFNVDASTASVATGISVKGAATAGTTTISATDSGATSGLTIQSKGAGNLSLNAGTTGNGGAVKLQTNGTDRISVENYRIVWTPNVATTGNARFLYTPSADLTLLTTVNAPLWDLAGAGIIRQHATGTLALQTDYRITGATDSFVAASALTTKATLSVAPGTCGTNGTCTNQVGILVPTTAVTATNGYGAQFNATTGATNNYAAQFVGPVLNTATITTGGYTVATLPTGATGMRAYVTDAVACTFMGALTGGGSTVCPVFYNGSAWLGG